MATDVDQAYFAWRQEELTDRNDSQGVSVSQMLDHGSISFGKFELESLSWEKWSVFTHDRRQEELEKFNGLVAQKKAYFEEYYRKLRALKALRQQQNQQTELTLDYSGDGSLSSQTGEDDDTASQLESLRDGTANITVAPEEATVTDTFEQGINLSEGSEVRKLDTEFSSSHLASSKGKLEKIEEERKIQPFVKGSIMSFRTCEMFAGNGSGSLNDKEISTKYQNQQSDPEHHAASHQTIVESMNSQDGDAELRLSRKSIPDKPKLPRKKPLDHKPVTKKESAPSTRLGLNLKQKTKPDMVQSSERAKQTLQKTIARAGSSNHRTKEAAPRVTSTNRSSSVTSHRPLTEIRPNITTPRPLSAARERRAVVRENTVKMDSKASKREVLPPNYSKAGPSWQGTKKMATPSTVKSSMTETRREYKKVLKEPLASERKHASTKSSDAHFLGTPKSRSIDFPPRKTSSSSCRTELQFMEASQRNKQKEGNKEIKLAQSRGAATKIVVPSRPGSSTGSQKPLPPKTGASHTGSKRQVTSLSLNGRKLK